MQGQAVDGCLLLRRDAARQHDDASERRERRADHVSAIHRRSPFECHVSAQRQALDSKAPPERPSTPA
jgi:hypothetical protein